MDQLEQNKKVNLNEKNERMKQMEENLIESENKNILQLNDI